MRRLTTTVLTACVLALAACGDDEETAGGGGSDTAAAETTAETTGEQASAAAGCRAVDEPKPKKVPSKAKRPKMTVDEKKRYTAVVKTNCGTFRMSLDVKRAPKTVNSFVSLARSGFFDDTAFHRIVPGFVIQGGDPLGTGQGGPGYDVVEAPPENVKYTKGVVAMAKTELDDPGTSGSQFYVVTAEDAGLPPEYALLGKVSGGQEVVDRIGEAPNDPADNRPTEPIVMEDVTIQEGS
jgi:cyclophilin family peptidyl-prolyl cis-trans isomerase